MEKRGLTIKYNNDMDLGAQMSTDAWWRDDALYAYNYRACKWIYPYENEPWLYCSKSVVTMFFGVLITICINTI